jgi:hypothetical protein
MLGWNYEIYHETAVPRRDIRHQWDLALKHARH